jgi:hypothetical protein
MVPLVQVRVWDVHALPQAGALEAYAVTLVPLPMLPAPHVQGQGSGAQVWLVKVPDSTPLLQVRFWPTDVHDAPQATLVAE